MCPPERSAWLAWLPILASAFFYALPSDFLSSQALQFLPQAVAYAGLAAWAARNSDITARLGLCPSQLGQGLRWGLPTGLLLGMVNTGVILWLVPRLGYDITFLRQTPHAQIPPVIMLPWFILLIALLIEVNFRGFLLGRLPRAWPLAFPPWPFHSTPFWWRHSGTCTGSPCGTVWCGACSGCDCGTSTFPSWPMQSKSW